MIKYLFKRDTLLATIIVFIVIALLALIPINTHIPNLTKPALQDFNSNKLTYSQLNKNSNSAVDACITIINIGIAGHAEIAAMIEKAVAENPAVAKVAFTEKYKQLVEREKITEQINYSKTTAKYLVTDGVEYHRDTKAKVKSCKYYF